MEAKDTRGSARLIDAYKNRGVTLNEDFVAKLSDSLGELTVNGVLVRGMPHPDWFRAGFTTSGPEETSKVIERILGTVAEVPLAEIRLFPKGIPWPGEFNIELTIEQR
ncbi:hypothetical protein [Microbacterium sp. RU33B]|uniref:hypothetical protein n=1 Tax=Microbacterium sp. RU33B TaxID=1907390 RepID=UPI00095E8000|nr:hypothetical protein [Microbacterium sp. RU33B]SIT75228.1 hypothetical protein SAMN05880545_1441 [Microbacterium sp. RU33B]